MIENTALEVAKQAPLTPDLLPPVPTGVNPVWWRNRWRRHRQRPPFVWKTVCKKVRVLDRPQIPTLSDVAEATELQPAPANTSSYGLVVALIAIPIAYYLGLKTKTS